MKLDDKAIDYLEQFIPELAAIATRKAYLDALASGSSVLIAEDGELKEVFPDGTKKVIEKIQPLVKVQKGIMKIQ